MKKLTGITILSFTILSGINLSVNFSEAATINKSNINYLDSKVIKKIKDGKMSNDGVKLGTPVNSLLNNKNYYYDRFSDHFSLRNSHDFIYTDLQSDIPLEKRVVNRFEDDNIRQQKIISRSNILKKYGPPTKAKVIKSTAFGSNVKYHIDFYKNATFIYGYNSKDKTHLQEVQFKKYTDSENFKTWQSFILEKFDNQAGFLHSQMSITQNQWDSY